MNLEFFRIAEGDEIDIPCAPEPEKVPEYPAEVWQKAPVDGDLAMAAVRSMCGG